MNKCPKKNRPQMDKMEKEKRSEKMQIIENSKVKEKLYIEKLENGLTVMIIPKKGIQKKYMGNKLWFK